MTPHYWQDACEYLSAKDEVMARLIAEYEGEGLQLKGDGFHTLARAIVGQQVSVQSADSIWGKLEDKGAIKPKIILNHSDEDYRECGFSRQKIRYIRNIAEFIITHNGVWQGSDEELIAELTQIVGVGTWTAEMFLFFHLGRPDLFPLKDIGLLKACEKHYEIDRKDAAKIGEKFKPYRTVATWYLWRSLDPVVVSY